MSTTEKTRRSRQRKALAPGNKSHGQRRTETMPLNDTPNDRVRVEESAKVQACQRCHHKFAKQFSVATSEEGERSIVKAISGASHYCADCAKERRDELQRFDSRPKTKKATPSKSAKAPAKKTGSARVKTARKVRAKAKVAKLQTKEQVSAEEPF